MSLTWVQYPRDLPIFYRFPSCISKEQLGLKLVPIWDACIASGNFTCDATMLIPVRILSQDFLEFINLKCRAIDRQRQRDRSLSFAVSLPKQPQWLGWDTLMLSSGLLHECRGLSTSVSFLCFSKCRKVDWNRLELQQLKLELTSVMNTDAAVSGFIHYITALALKQLFLIL